MSLALLKINLSQALHWPLVVLKRPAALDTGQAWPRTVTMARCSFQSLTASTCFDPSKMVMISLWRSRFKTYFIVKHCQTSIRKFNHVPVEEEGDRSME